MGRSVYVCVQCMVVTGPSTTVCVCMCMCMYVFVSVSRKSVLSCDEKENGK